jgi:hypothetical protein
MMIEAPRREKASGVLWKMRRSRRRAKIKLESVQARGERTCQRRSEDEGKEEEVGRRRRTYTLREYRDLLFLAAVPSLGGLEPKSRRRR